MLAKKWTVATPGYVRVEHTWTRSECNVFTGILEVPTNVHDFRLIWDEFDINVNTSGIAFLRLLNRMNLTGSNQPTRDFHPRDGRAVRISA